MAEKARSTVNIDDTKPRCLSGNAGDDAAAKLSLFLLASLKSTDPWGMEHQANKCDLARQTCSVQTDLLLPLSSRSSQCYGDLRLTAALLW